MQSANADSVLGDFADVRFAGEKETTRFFRKGEEFWINATDADGEQKDFRVAYAFGIEPLQQYLIETGGGHLQALGVAWDTRKSVWFELYPGQGVNFKDPLHWSKPQQNANFMCIECHSTGMRRNYDPAGNRYSSTWQATGVGCQSCHGPASAHLEWTRQPERWSGAGFLRSPKNANSRQEVEACGRCHSRRAQLGDGFRAHANLMDDYLPSPLTPLLYEIDGKIRDEVFEYGSFKQSKMFAKGVSCSDCHEPHSLEPRAVGNALCVQCHNRAGRPRRRGIDASGLHPMDYDSPAHHGHRPGSPAAQCSSCHMPGRLFMVNDLRHDHSFSAPNPARARRLGTTDACQGCHSQMPAAELAEHFEQMFPEAAPRDGGYAEALHLARQGLPGAAAALLGQLQRSELPAIRRATLLAELTNYPSDAALLQTINDLRNADAQVREAAVHTLAALQPGRVDLLGPLLKDPVRAVRIAVVGELLELPAEQFGAYLPTWRLATGEYEQVQRDLLERPEANLNLAQLFQAEGKHDEIEPLLRTALQRDTDYLPALVALAQQLPLEEANQLLKRGLKDHPDSALLWYSQGMGLVRAGQAQRALLDLRKAAELEPDNTEFAYVLGIALFDQGRQQEAIDHLRRQLDRQPQQRQIRLALIDYLRRTGQVEQARQILETLAALNPDDPALSGLNR